MRIELTAGCAHRVRKGIVIHPHNCIAGFHCELLGIESHRLDDNRVMRGRRFSGRDIDREPQGSRRDDRAHQESASDIDARHTSALCGKRGLDTLGVFQVSDEGGFYLNQ
jgi:hypothetical protein